MAESPVGNTALGAAICRLIEQYQPERTRLISDPVVKDLVGGSVRTLMRFGPLRDYTLRQTESNLNGLYGSQICRSRFIDDAVISALSSGIRQLVILGAGLDTRAYRLAGLENTKVVEVDLPSVQNQKRRRLEARFGQLPENVTLAPIDFNVQDLADALKGTPFYYARPAVYVWEGVTQYISEDSVRRTFSFVGNSANGSVVLFTYVLKAVVERRSDVPDSNKMMDTVAKRGVPWVFGLEPSEVSTYLKQFNLNVVTDIGNTDYQTRYLKPIGRKLAVSEIERTIHAQVVRS